MSEGRSFSAPDLAEVDQRVEVVRIALEDPLEVLAGEQPVHVAAALEARASQEHAITQALGVEVDRLLEQVDRIQGA
ncbi:MAG: hypothetical protein ACYS6Z_19510 [Planctomycetota bacterium]